MSYDAMPARSYGLEMASKITQIATDERLDIVHCHYAVPHAISGIIAKQVLGAAGPKIVTTLHGTDITLVGSAPAFFPLTKWSIENSDAVTAVSNWLSAETRRTFETDKAISVIHNFVDTDRFVPGRSRCHREHFAAPDEKIIIHVSNFRPVKRLEDVVRVFAGIVKTMPARLILIGDGPERERTMELARNLGVMNRTFFLGRQSMVENYYAIADLLLFPSEYESFGVAALESMSSGVPVVTTQGSGLAEVVTDGVNGFLRPVGDVEALTQAALTILGNDEMGCLMGGEGRKRALGCFRASRIMGIYLSLYDDVLAGRTPPTDMGCPEAGRLA